MRTELPPSDSTTAAGSVFGTGSSVFGDVRRFIVEPTPIATAMPTTAKTTRAARCHFMTAWA
ncbi:MAG: hypothetical protein QM736_07965 [Vicinamibacterales bacterium]